MLAAAGLIVFALAGCSWDFPESTKKMLAAERGAEHIEVTRDDLPAGSYQSLGWISAPRMPPPCDKFAVAQDAFEKFGSKVDAL
jgi:hypothetical protein